MRIADPREALRRLFARCHAPIDELLSATPTEAVLRHDIFDLAALPPSSVHRRGVLLGNAAHATTPDLGQGAGQALEDAATLVNLLRRARPDHIEAVLEQYDRLRRTRTLWCQSRLAGKVAQAAGPITRCLCDGALRAAPASLMTRAMARLQGSGPPGD